MKISYNWLCDYLDFELTPEACIQILTEIGLEVDGFTQLGQSPEKLAGLLVGEVTDCKPHPNADKLKLTTVNIGGESPLSIVCGAPNVAIGQKVVVAPVGCTLYPRTGEPFKIQKAKIRGEVSMGMLCAEDEIGLGNSHDGIMVLDAAAIPGQALTEVLEIKADYEIEIGLTPNRSDAISHYGVARDLAAYHRKKAVLPDCSLPFSATGDEIIQLSIEAPEACTRFSGMAFEGIQIGPSPAWLQARLLAIGHQPINNVVDITNYVMFELGQPLHAYDLRQLRGNQLNVRFAQSGEKITLLNKQAYTLQPDNLLICNAEGPMGVAGVMGGIHDSIQPDTTSIYLESAHFNPAVIRKSSKILGVKSDAAYRFERGCDPEITAKALSRAARLLVEITGAKPLGGLQDLLAQRPTPKAIHLLYPNIDRIVGTKIKRETIKEILHCLDFEIKNDLGDALTVLAPQYRVDVTREIDVIEEIIRIYGLNNIQGDGEIRYHRAHPLRNNKNDWQQTIAELLVNQGFYETLSLSFISDKSLQLLPQWEGKEVRVLNPVNEEVPVLRPSLLFNGLQNIQHNVNRKAGDLHLFEFGKVFFRQQKSRQEQEMLGLWLCGQQQAESWYAPTRKVDFHHAHAFLRLIFQRMGVIKLLQSQAGDQPGYSYSLNYVADGKTIATVGALAPALLKRFDLKQEVFYAEIDWQALLRLATKPIQLVQELSRFPSVRRDLALVIDQQTSYRDLEKLAFETAGPLLRQLNLFDIYEGEKIAAGKRSYALSFVLEDNEKTMTDHDIEQVMQKLITKFETTLAATVRQ